MGIDRFAGFYGSNQFAGFRVGQIGLLHSSSTRRRFAGFYGLDQFMASCGLWVVPVMCWLWPVIGVVDDRC